MGILPSGATQTPPNPQDVGEGLLGASVPRARSPWWRRCWRREFSGPPAGPACPWPAQRRWPAAATLAVPAGRQAGCGRGRGGRASPPGHCGGGRPPARGAGRDLRGAGLAEAGLGRPGAGGGAVLRLGRALGLRGLSAAAATAAASSSSLPALPVAALSSFPFFASLFPCPGGPSPPPDGRRSAGARAVAAAAAGAPSACSQVRQPSPPRVLCRAPLLLGASLSAWREPHPGAG